MSDQNMTVLEVVNSVCSDMGRDRVNDLGQTPEATRVESIARDTFYQIITRKDWPNKRKLTNLESLSDLSRRTCLRLPNEVDRIEELSYNCGTLADPVWNKLVWLDPEVFARRIMGNSDLTHTEGYTNTTIDGVKFLVGNEAAPSYWTSFDDETIVLDSYDKTKEDTVQGSKTAAWVYTTPAWPLTKDDKIPLPPKYMPMYLSLTKAACFEKIKKQESGTDLYWGRANMARLNHEERVSGRNRSEKRKRYGRRRPY